MSLARSLEGSLHNALLLHRHCSSATAGGNCGYPRYSRRSPQFVGCSRMGARLVDKNARAASARIGANAAVANVRQSSVCSLDAWAVVGAIEAGTATELIEQLLDELARNRLDHAVPARPAAILGHAARPEQAIGPREMHGKVDVDRVRFGAVVNSASRRKTIK
jgi:hypothetical protein